METVIVWSCPFDEAMRPDIEKVLPLGGPDVVAWVVDPLGGYVGREALAQYPKLRVLATPSTGTNHIDLRACKKAGVRVVSLLDNRAELEKITSSAEHTLWLLVTLFRAPPESEMSDKTLGLVGYGRIGRHMEQYAKALRMYTHYHDPARARSVPLRDIFRESDAVVVCCSLTDKTKGMIGKKLLRSMKHGARLVNTSRGEVLREDDLLSVMQERKDLRVAVDVVEGEVSGRPNWDRLMSAGAFVTPHRAGMASEARHKAAKIIAGLLVGAFGAVPGTPAYQAPHFSVPVPRVVGSKKNSVGNIV